ncbi:MAG: hypothetical protein AAF195_02865, partial [Pseudomonadota bacterium]
MLWVYQRQDGTHAFTEKKNDPAIPQGSPLNKTSFQQVFSTTNFDDFINDLREDVRNFINENKDNKISNINQEALEQFKWNCKILTLDQHKGHITGKNARNYKQTILGIFSDTNKTLGQAIIDTKTNKPGDVQRFFVELANKMLSNDEQKLYNQEKIGEFIDLVKNDYYLNISLDKQHKIKKNFYDTIHYIHDNANPPIAYDPHTARNFFTDLKRTKTKILDKINDLSIKRDTDSIIYKKFQEILEAHPDYPKQDSQVHVMSTMPPSQGYPPPNHPPPNPSQTPPQVPYIASEQPVQEPTVFTTFRIPRHHMPPDPLDISWPKTFLPATQVSQSQSQPPQQPPEAQALQPKSPRVVQPSYVPPDRLNHILEENAVQSQTKNTLLPHELFSHELLTGALLDQEELSSVISSNSDDLQAGSDDDNYNSKKKNKTTAKRKRNDYELLSLDTPETREEFEELANKNRNELSTTEFEKLKKLFGGIMKSICEDPDIKYNSCLTTAVPRLRRLWPAASAWQPSFWRKT